MPTQLKPLHILICRLSAHGDVIQTLPLLSALKGTIPDCRIGWLVEASAAPLLENHPLIDQLHICPLKAWRTQLQHPAEWFTTGQAIQGFIEILKRAEYDVSLDVQGLLKSAVWPWLAGIPKRVGFDKTREQAAIFYNHRLPPHDLKNPSLRTVDLFASFASSVTNAPLPTPSYQLSPLQAEAEDRVAYWLNGLPRPYLVLAPGTVWPSKQWSYWPQLFAALREQHPTLTVLLVGGPTDVLKINDWLAASVQDFPEHWRNLVGQTDWPTLQVLLTQADFLVGPDSAALHLANAAGRARILGLYGPTAPGRTGPIGEGHMVLTTDLPCQPCFERRCPIKTHDCLEQLRVDSVMATLNEWILEEKA